MTAFSDDDMRRLRLKIEQVGFTGQETSDLESLLARLEAAEKALDRSVCQCISHGFPEAIEAWRKAAGKGH